MCNEKLCPILTNWFLFIELNPFFLFFLLFIIDFVLRIQQGLHILLIVVFNTIWKNWQGCKFNLKSVFISRLNIFTGHSSISGAKLLILCPSKISQSNRMFFPAISDIFSLAGSIKLALCFLNTHFSNSPLHVSTFKMHSTWKHYATFSD